MKYFIILLLSTGLITGQAIADENTSKSSSYEVIKSETSFFGSLWGKIKRIIPRKHTTEHTATAVIGVRGAETTESALKPYWEGDLTTDPTFRNDVKQFDDATKLCESKTPSKGTDTFEALLKSSSNDMLKANTLIALASCYAQQGDEAKGREHLQAFVVKYPTHPMHDDVNAWLTANK
ncbi:MAG: hypothetical protein R8M46_08445 [Ghiorsea sp.]